MEEALIGFLVGLGVVAALALLGIRAAYQNGCVDGYGYAQEPDNPGYQTAGSHLKKTMAHRWSELRD